MSIISEALKKANTERGVSAPAALTTSRAGFGRTIATVCVLTLVVVPFLLPRFLNRSAGGRATPHSAQTHLPLPLADAPDARPEVGLAQMSVESGSIAAASMPSQATALPLKTADKAFILQGTVWTQNKGRYAILNGNVLRKGSMIGNYRVEHIGDGKITLSDGSQKLTIDKSV